ncbi:MAG TPA: ATP-binding protein [Planctomycetaceae bacterium]|jgi:signal transduction histidine kinase|nr:ATP-binding protein [Planctomycetaceae bacterium]
MLFGGRGILWRTAAPTLALSVLLLATIAVAALALRRMQLEADRVIDQALAATEAAQHIEHVFEDCRERLTDYAATGQPSEVEKARGLEKESSDDLIQIDTLLIPERGHLLIAEMETYTVVLRRELNQIHPTASLEAREAAVRRVLGTVLDSQLLSRAREERELCIENLHAARARGLEVTRRADWALLVFGVVGTVGGIVTGFGLARSLRRELIELSIPIRSAMGSLNEVVGPVQVVSTDNFAELDATLGSLAKQVAQVVERLQLAERERLRNDQMAALGQLAAGLAHELRNPLTAMKTIVDAARREPVRDSLNARDLAVLDEEIQRLNRSLQSFLDYARPPATTKRLVDLRTIANKTRQLLAGRAEQQSICVCIEQPEHAVEVEVDPEQLHQVLLNLLLNAFDAIGRDGKVTIRIAEDAQGYAVLTVADSGPGIPQAVRDRVFEPFVSTKESGTGLGLTICRRIVEDHGGRIDATDGRGGGAIFTVKLPIDRALPTADGLAMSGNLPTSGSTDADPLGR